MRLKIRNSTSTSGAGLTGLTNASSGLIVSTIADDEAAATAYTAAGATIDTIATLGTYAAPTATHCRFKEVDSTNHKGVYELQFENTRFNVASSKSLLISISGATNAAECDVCIPLRSVNPYDGVRFGMTALPNAAAAANGGLPTVDAANGVKVSVGTGTGQINASSGKVPATLASTDVTGNVASDVQTIKTQTVTCSAGVTVNPNVGTTQPVNFTGTGASALVKSDVIDWSSAAVAAPNVSGVPIVDVKYSSGTQVFNSDGTLASATATTVTFPTTDSAGNTIPDDGRYAYTVIQIEAGTGVGQVVVLTSKSGIRTFNILSGTCPVQLDATSKYVVLGSWRSELELWEGVAPNALISGRVDSNTQATASSLSYNLTGNITGNLTGSVGSVTGSVNSVTTTVASNVIQWSGGAVAGSIPPDVVFLRSGTAQAGGASTITLDAGASAVNNFYQNAVVFIRSGTGAGQCALITTYVGATKVATINGTWATNPDATSVFSLLPFGAISASVAGNVTVGGYAAGQDPAAQVLATPSQKLATNASGFVTVATNNDKTGYSLSQAFPINFSALSIDANGRVELQSGITKNTALNNFEFLLVSSTDHVTPVTGATVTATRSLDGAAFGACANAVTEVGSGIYTINLAAADTNAGIVTLKMSATGADTRYITLVTTP